MIRIEMKFLWFFPYHNTTVLPTSPFLFWKWKGHDKSQVFLLLHLLEKWCHWHLPPSSNMDGRALVLLWTAVCTWEGKFFDYLHRVPRVVMPAKMRNETFVPNYFLHGCLLLICINVTCQDSFFVMPFKKSWSGVVVLHLATKRRRRRDSKMGSLLILPTFNTKDQTFWLGAFSYLTFSSPKLKV